MNASLHKSHFPLMLCGSLSFILYYYLASQSTVYVAATLWDLWLVCGFCGVLSIISWYYYEYYRIKPSLYLIIGFAIAFRLLGFVAFPILEDDFYRYLWDGYMLVEYGTPYGVPPSDFFSNDNINENFENILSNINYPDVPTIYGPVLQWFFALSYLIAPGELWPIKGFLVFADIVIIFLLISLTKISSVKNHYLILYAWCPLIIKEFAITAHPDVIGVMFMMIALLLAHKKYYYWVATMLALAVATKVFAIIITPLLLGLYWRRWVVFVMVAIGIALPFGLRDAWLPGGLVTMANDWLFNAPIYLLLKSYLTFNTAKILLLAIFSLTWIAVFFRSSLFQNPIKIRGDYLFGMFFLCIPVLNPWYMIWLLPFAVIYPSCWAWVASLSLFISYASGINTNDDQSSLYLYEQQTIFVLVEFGLIALGLFIDRIRKVQMLKSK